MTSHSFGALAMNRLVQHVVPGLLAVVTSATLMTACTHEGAPNAQPQPSEALASQTAVASAGNQVTTEAKTIAPVQLVTIASGRSGTVDVTLKVHPTTHAARGVARIVIPAGVTLVSGEHQRELGAMELGADQELKVTLQVPVQGQFKIYSGVDVYIASGVMLHKESPPITLGE